MRALTLALVAVNSVRALHDWDSDEDRWWSPHHTGSLSLWIAGGFVLFLVVIIALFWFCHSDDEHDHHHHRSGWGVHGYRHGYDGTAAYAAVHSSGKHGKSKHKSDRHHGHHYATPSSDVWTTGAPLAGPALFAPK